MTNNEVLYRPRRWRRENKHIHVKWPDDETMLTIMWINAWGCAWSVSTLENGDVDNEYYSEGLSKTIEAAKCTSMRVWQKLHE